MPRSYKNRHSRDVVAEEYEDAAAWCAARGLKGAPGDTLPQTLSARVLASINGDPDAFQARVRDYAYAAAMERTGGNPQDA